MMNIFKQMISNKRVYNANTIFKINNEVYFTRSRDIKKVLFFFKKNFRVAYKKRSILTHIFETWLESWKELDFTKVKITKNMKYLPQLNLSNCISINLFKNQIFDGELISLSKANLDNLRFLCLGDNRITDEGIKMFFKQQFLFKLENLDLSYNSITSNSLQILAEAKLKNLTHLNVSYNEISPEGIKYLKDISEVGLTYLDLSYNVIEETGVIFLKEVNLENLKFLNLCKSKIGAAGVAQLNKIHFPNLENLNLSGNNIGLEGAIHVRDMRIESLTTLNLRHNSFGDEGMRQFVNGYVGKLNEIDLSFNNVTKLGLAYLDMSDMRLVKNIKV